MFLQDLAVFQIQFHKPLVLVVLAPVLLPIETALF